MASLAWDEFMFSKKKLVAVDPWGGASLELLDVFTVSGTYGLVKRGPKLKPAGALPYLAKKGEEPSASQTNLEDARARRSIHVTSGRAAALTAPLKASSRISGSALQVVTAEHTSDRGLLASVETVTFEKFDQNVLVNLVSEGKWKPDFEKPQLPRKWNHVLWVVQEVFYAKKLIIGLTNHAIVKACMNPSKVAPVGALPVDLQGKVEVSKSVDETYVFTAPEGGRFPIGFKCIRLAYNQNGELQTPGGANFDMGEQRPKLRADVDAWLNPDKYSEFHMGDLLISREPGGPMECLPIVADDKEEK